MTALIISFVIRNLVTFDFQCFSVDGKGVHLLTRYTHDQNWKILNVTKCKNTDVGFIKQLTMFSAKSRPNLKTISMIIL